MSKNEAIEKKQGMLVKKTYNYLEPEFIQSFETGYKGLFLRSRLYIDADFYFNKYHAFIAQVEASVPKTTIPDSIPYYLNDKKLQDRYRLWTNSKTTVYNVGGS